MNWQAGSAKRVVTPQTPVWLAGYGTRREPEGTLHDLWIKTIALRDPAGRQVVLVTTDHMGMSRTIYDRMLAKLQSRCGIAPADFMYTFSHNHCGPVLQDDLQDYYPLDDQQRQLVHQYTDCMEDQVVDACLKALENQRPADLFMAERVCTFAVNRRENSEQDVAEGKPLKGVVDHAVPVLAVRSDDGGLLAALFGYACHPTTLSCNYWCGDYPGWAQLSACRIVFGRIPEPHSGGVQGV